MELKDFYSMMISDLKNTNLTDINTEALIEDLNKGINNVFQNNMPADDRIAGFIEKYSDFDLDQETIEILIRKVKISDYWNTSLKKIYQIYNSFFGKSRNKKSFTLSNGREVKVSELIEADAANSFDRDNEWVKPWVSFFDKKKEIIEGVEKENYKNYSDVRSKDAFLKAISEDANLQFTHEKGEDWIRLIMPKNTRRVEVEDLNRNFWVIAITLSAVLAFLFDENSPLKNIFKDILDEILQLWENCFYLWLTLDAINQEKKNTLYTECSYFSPNFSPNELQFDDFEIFDRNWRDNLELKRKNGVKYYGFKNLGNYLPLFKKYKEKFQNRNLCIIPIFRIYNYKHNYFKEIIIPFIYLYDVSSNNEQLIENITKINNNYTVPAVNIEDTTFNGKFIKDFIGAIHAEEDYYLKIYPFSNISLVEEEKPQKYYASIRPIPTLNVEYNDGFKIDFSLNFEDCTNPEDNNYICGYSAGTGEFKASESNIFILKENENFRRKKKYIISQYKNYLIGKDYYLGEVISDYNYSSASFNYEVLGIDDFISDSLLVKIGNFLYLPEGGKSYIPNLQITSNDNLTSYDLNFTLNKATSVSLSDAVFQSSYDSVFCIPSYTGVHNNYDGNGDRKEIQNYFTIVNEQLNNNKGVKSFTEDIKELLKNWNIPNEETEKIKGYLKFSNDDGTIDLQFLRELGLYIIRQYLYLCFEGNQLKSDKYFTICSAIGGIPWQGTKNNQQYWIKNILCHLFYYLPKELAYDKNGQLRYKSLQSATITKVGDYGILFCAGRINRNEYNFGASNNGSVLTNEELNNNNFNFEQKGYLYTNNSDRWRLPQIDTVAEQYSSIRIKATRVNVVNNRLEEYYYWLEMNSALQTERDNCQSDEEFFQLIENQLNNGYYLNDKQSEDDVYNKIIGNIINSPKFYWSKYDGYRPLAEGATNKNIEKTRIGEKYRQILYAPLKLKNNNGNYKIESNGNFYLKTTGMNNTDDLIEITNETQKSNIINMFLDNQGYDSNYGALVFKNDSNYLEDSFWTIDINDEIWANKTIRR